MFENRSAALETIPGGLTILIRDERVAAIHRASYPGLMDIRVEGRKLTRQIRPELPDIYLSHGNVNGLNFGPDSTTSDSKSGHIETTGLIARRGSQSVGFRQEMLWQNRAYETLAEVALVVRASAGPSNGAVVDITMQIIAGETSEVVLGETFDSLLHIQLAANLLPERGGHVRNAFGDLDPSTIDGRRSPWFGCVGVINAQTVGMSIIDHPDNPVHPPTWRLSESGKLSLSAFENCAVTLLAYESLTLRFRIQTYAGYVDDGWTSARCNEFACEPLRV